MARFLYQVFPPSRRRTGLVFLASFWLTGLFAGVGLFLRSDDTALSMMCGAQGCPVSIVHPAVFLPFLLSAFALAIRQGWLIALISFGKAFLMAYMICLIQAVYPLGSWLAVGLLLFGSLLSAAVLWVYWLRAPDKSVVGWLTALAMIGCADRWIISPFLAGL